MTSSSSSGCVFLRSSEPAPSQRGSRRGHGRPCEASNEARRSGQAGNTRQRGILIHAMSGSSSHRASATTSRKGSACPDAAGRGKGCSPASGSQAAPAQQRSQDTSPRRRTGLRRRSALSQGPRLGKLRRFMHRSRRPTDRRSAASNSADRARPSHRSMPPGDNQRQLNQSVAGPSATACWAALARRREETPHGACEPTATRLERSLVGVSTPILRSETDVGFSEGRS